MDFTTFTGPTLNGRESNPNALNIGVLIFGFHNTIAIKSLFEHYKVYCILYKVVYSYQNSELGTRQFCRDNVTRFSGHKVVIYCNITVFVWLLLLVARSKYFSNFSCPRGSMTVSRCRLRKAQKLSCAHL